MQPDGLARSPDIGAATLASRRGDAVDAGPDLPVVETGISGAGGDRGIGRLDRQGYRVLPTVQRLRAGDELGDILATERQPTAQSVVDIGLGGQ